MAGLHAQRPGALKGVLGGHRPRGRNDIPGGSLRELLDETARALALAALVTAAEEALELLPSEVPQIEDHPARPSHSRRWSDYGVGRYAESAASVCSSRRASSRIPVVISSRTARSALSALSCTAR